jgi:hypothetical protein|tara:strand:- start:170 stop:307 length:138 start_codon:yes stop_codon:yes gene_type:complete
MNKSLKDKKINKHTGKAHSYIFKWYACGYLFIAIAVLYLNYDRWF